MLSLRLCHLPLTCLPVLFLANLACSGATFSILHLNGDASPDGVGGFLSFNAPSLNNSGQVAFEAKLSGTGVTSANYEAIYRSQSGSAGTLIAREGVSTVYDGAILQAAIHSTGPPLINDSGMVAFENGQGIYRHSGSGLQTIIQYGTTIHGGAGGSNWIMFPYGISLNESGQVGFSTGHNAITYPNGGSFIGDGSSVTRHSPLGLVGVSAVPAGGPPALNDSGTTAHSLSSTYQGVATSDGVTCTQVPGMPWSSQPAINSAGQVACITPFNGGLYIDGVNIVPGGSPSPDGDGSLNINDRFSFNDAGQVTGFAGFLEYPGDAQMIFRAESNGDLTKIARTGEEVPGGGATFYSFNGIASGLQWGALNASGQVAFLARLWDGSVLFLALYVYDDSAGLVEVVREGDSLAGGVVQDLRFSCGADGSQDSLSGPVQGQRGSGFNDSGHVAFAFTLADGTQGVALADPFSSTPVAESIRVTSLAGGPGAFTVNWLTTPPGAPVDIYRSSDLASWGAPIEAGNAFGSFLDSTAPSTRAFYTIVPAGNPYPPASP